MQVTRLGDDKLERILFELEDYQISHGSLLKIPRALTDLESAVAVAHPIGVSVVPTRFPRLHFEHAQDIQPFFNELYMSVSEDYDWLESIIRPLGEVDEHVGKLWSIWERVREKGEVQPLRCGIFRSDYMLHYNQKSTEGQHGIYTDPSDQVDRSVLDSELKQVEFNTYSCAGGTHANIVANMHRYLIHKGVHETASLPANSSLMSIVEALAVAHQAYGPPISQTCQAAILMTVQPNNVNICDERPIEYALLERKPPIMLFRVCFGGAVLQKCRLGPNRELLFQLTPETVPIEISVVYQRAGYDSHEYDQKGIDARLLLEISRAIKCPTILSHMAGFKKVQQELTRPGVLERFLSSEKAVGTLRHTFMPQFPMDPPEDGDGDGIMIEKITRDRKEATNYVLKPSLEGGGHNIYGADIPDFLDTVPREARSKYILMEKIHPIPMHGVLVSPESTFQGPVVSELGVLGTCLWRRKGGSGERPQILESSGAGWTFKTKSKHVEEMSVVKGYGCFDCPSLF